MSYVSGWVLSIVGVIVITVIVEIIMPEGSINKFIKGLLVLFTVFIMVSPITNISIEELFGGKEFEIKIDENYLEDVNSKKIEEYRDIILEKLKNIGISGVELDIHCENKGGEIKINAIFVNLSDLVLNNKTENINKYDNIKKIIRSVVDVAEGDVIFYE